MAQGLEAVEILDGAAVMAFGLGLIAEEQSNGVGLSGDRVPAFGHTVVAVLGFAEFDVIVEEEFIEQDQGAVPIVDGFVEAGGEEAGLEAGGAEEALLGEGDTLDGEEFLGVDGLVDGHGVVAERFR